MLKTALQSVWTEPRPPEPPRRVWQDWAIMAVFLPAAIVEFILRTDVLWPVPSLIFGLAAIASLWWRRSHPFAVTIGVFGGGIAMHLASVAADAAEPWGLYTSAIVLILPYALFRWAPGHQVALALPVLVISALVQAVGFEGSIAGAVACLVAFCVPAELGAVIRFRTHAEEGRVSGVRLQEREQLARELHDTVAHHVSAIAIQAQAGRVLGHSGSPEGVEAAMTALETIEEEAARALSEMRAMVDALRSDDAPAMAPQQGLMDLDDLNLISTPSGPIIHVEQSGDLAHLRPALEAAVFRLAQESVTNAVRHARGATRVDVSVSGDDRVVRLSVVDDGRGPSSPTANSGYGLVGMSERAALLGGELRAGPRSEGGWSVTVELPRQGRTTRTRVRA